MLVLCKGEFDNLGRKSLRERRSGAFRKATGRAAVVVEDVAVIAYLTGVYVVVATERHVGNYLLNDNAAVKDAPGRSRAISVGTATANGDRRRGQRHNGCGRNRHIAAV